MIKRIRINNDIKVDWTVNIKNSEGEIADLSSFDLAVDLIVGTKVFHVTDFTVSDNLISFVYYGSEQVYTGSYVLKLYDATNTSVTYDVKTAFVLMEHSWFSPDIITVPTSVEIASSVSVAQIIAVPGPKGDVGVESATASIDDIGDVPTVEVTLQDKNLDFAFHGIKGSGGGGGGGGTGKDGRSITGVQNWFKLSASTSVSAPIISIADPSSAAGGGWSLTAGGPTVQLPYLWCFMQVNYDKPLSSGYTYSRSSAYIARRYNSDSSQEFESLEEMIEQLRSDMESDMAGYENDLRQLNTSLNNLRTQVERSMAGDIAALKSRFNNIDGTDVKKIEDDEDGLWGVLTSYDDDTKGQKSFSDIVLDAKNAKQTLSVGSEFFGNRTSAEVTLDGLKGQIALKATQDYVDSEIAQAQFSADPTALKSVISKGQKCWKKGTQLYPYDLYLSGFDGSISEYEEYMGKSPSEGGPEGDDVNPAGPFTIAVTVDQFSNIQQTVDSISSSMYEVKYAWEKDNDIYSYNNFEEEYEERSATYESYTYEEYVTLVLRYNKVEIGNVLSGIIQTSTEIESIVGDMGYIWRKSNGDGTYQYQRYAVPSNQTRDDYVAAMQNAGWSLYDYSQKMAVIDQTQDSITLSVKQSSLVWIDDTLPADDDDYCLDYDYWLDDYESSSYSGTYEEYVSYYHSEYELTKVSDSMSRIKQTASSISSVVSDVEDVNSRMSAVEQTVDGISLAATKGGKAWKKTISGQDDIKAYDYFEDDYESSGSSLEYEAWVIQTQGYSIEDIIEELGAVKVQSDKVFAGITDSNGNVAASIEIIRDARTAAGHSKIVLDATNVEVTSTLSAGIVNTGFANVSSQLLVGKINDATGKINGTVITDSSITTHQIDVDNLAVKHLDAADGTFTGKFNATASHTESSGDYTHQLTLNPEVFTLSASGGPALNPEAEHIHIWPCADPDAYDRNGLLELYAPGKTALFIEEGFVVGYNEITQFFSSNGTIDWRGHRIIVTAACQLTLPIMNLCKGTHFVIFNMNASNITLYAYEQNEIINGRSGTGASSASNSFAPPSSVMKIELMCDGQEWYAIAL